VTEVTPEMYTRSPTENPCGEVVVNVARAGDPALIVAAEIVNEPCSEVLGYE